MRSRRGITTEVGLKVILPSTFTGGPRYMQQACADGIAVCTEYGKPDLFITMTCNPYWPEIKAELLPHQQPSAFLTFARECST